MRATALLWAAAFVCMIAITTWSGQATTRGDFIQMPFTYVFALGPALAFFFLFRATAGWRLWAAVVALAAAVPLIGLVQIVLDYSGQYLLRLYVVPDANPVIYQRDIIARVLFIYIALNAFNVAVIWLLGSHERAREQERRAARAQLDIAEAKAAALASELRALRLRLDPHFIFNALNSVASLIATDRPQQAEAMVMKLSDFLRGVLGAASPKVPLGDEISAVTDYIDVERVRFENGLDLEVNCPDDLWEALVPDFILQPLIENCVKYGRPLGRVLCISLNVSRDGGGLRLSVHDDGVGDPDGRPVQGFGLGQSTTEQRLKNLYGAAAGMKVSQSVNGYRVDLHLPLEFEADGVPAVPDAPGPHSVSSRSPDQ